MRNLRLSMFIALPLVVSATLPRQGVAQLTPSTPAISVAIDASQAPRKLFRAKETIPVKSGENIFYYAKWIPGEHGPTGPVVDFAGLKFFAAGKQIAWQRDSIDMYTFRVEVPDGVTSLEVTMDYLSPTAESGFSAAASATDQLCLVSWNWLVLYPKGFSSDDITMQASLKLPAGWKYGTSLKVASESGEEITFAPTSLTLLIDSPVIAGAHLKVVPLAPELQVRHEMDIAADSAAALEFPDSLKAEYDNLVREAWTLFGAHHYRDYHFLYTLSDHTAHFGLEHHESDDSRVPERTMVDGDRRIGAASLLPHEYVHSWNGKYRRPGGLATPEYETPMQGNMLWVYEGLTEYLGLVLTARSGLWTPDQFRDNLAIVAATYSHRPGRTWRPLEDTAVAAQILYGAPSAWSSYRRSVDYYDESALIWLEADTIIRQKTNEQKSMDDFCKIFHGGGDTGPMVKPYTFDDVVNTLNQVAPYDWKTFLNDRIYKVVPNAPLGGIASSGWRVEYTDQQSEMGRLGDSYYKALSAEDSVGLILDEDGVVLDTIFSMAADNAGIAPGMKVIGVNGRKYSKDVFKDALRATKTGGSLELLVENADYFNTFKLDYHDGLRYPHLVRQDGKRDVLADIIKPHAKAIQTGSTK
jgi:predicted metalloprotease with PDZ domain